MVKKCFWLVLCLLAVVNAKEDTFYSKSLEIDKEVYIWGSNKIEDVALKEAVWITNQMLKNSPIRGDILNSIASSGTRLFLMHQSKTVDDIPERRQHYNVRDHKQYFRPLWKGLSSNKWAYANEQTLFWNHTKPTWRGSIWAHEFSHVIHFKHPDFENFNRKLSSIYHTAMRKGKYLSMPNTPEYYGSTNHIEYWAMSTVAYFCETNGSPPFTFMDGTFSVTRESLRNYDPDIYALVEETFGKNNWYYTPPRNRLGKDHLIDFNLDKYIRTHGDDFMAFTYAKNRFFRYVCDTSVTEAYNWKTVFAFSPEHVTNETSGFLLSEVIAVNLSNDLVSIGNKSLPTNEVIKFHTNRLNLQAVNKQTGKVIAGYKVLQGSQPTRIFINRTDTQAHEDAWT
ncbi:MAG: hypothetical protein OXH16_01260 [Gemmatimonadetes bacterium]|nr:hypothetical protein [Gemmatimonadota bacterium]